MRVSDANGSAVSSVCGNSGRAKHIGVADVRNYVRFG